MGAVIAKLLEKVRQVIIETKKVVNCKRNNRALLKLLETIHPVVLHAAEDISTGEYVQVDESVSYNNAKETHVAGPGLNEGLVDVEKWLEYLRNRLAEAKRLVSDCDRLKGYEFKKLHMMSSRIEIMRDEIAKICTIPAPLALSKMEVRTAKGGEKTFEVVARLSDNAGNNVREITEWMAKLAEACGNLGESREHVIKITATTYRSGPARARTRVHRSAPTRAGARVPRRVRSIGSELPANGILHPGELLVSQSGEYSFVNQISDGNLVTYTKSGRPNWAANTRSSCLSNGGDLKLLPNGNLVLFDTMNTGEPFWASMSQRETRLDTGSYRMVMQDDGNLVIHGSSGTIWASQTPDITSNRFVSSAWSDKLSSGPSWLHTDEMLVSRNKLYKFVNQRDGNLCIYRETGEGTRAEDCVWASKTYGKGYRGNLYMQRNGNLVLYKTDGDEAAVWSSATSGRGTFPYELVMQDDGNLVIYDAHHTIIWAVPSNTPAVTRSLSRPIGDTLSSGYVLRPYEQLQSACGRFSFVNQADGNLVVYSQKRGPVWASNTCNHGLGSLYLHEDGTLVLYNGNIPNPDSLIWSTGIKPAAPSASFKLIIQDDGNLVLYDSHENPCWATNMRLAEEG